MFKIKAHWQILIALVASSILAIIFREAFGEVVESEPDGGVAAFVEQTLKVMGLLGDLFMTSLKMIIVPLIVSSVISSISGLSEMSGFARLGVKTLIFYAGSTLLAATVGLLMVNALTPGLENGVANENIRQAFEQSDQSADEEVKGRFADERIEQASDWTALFRKMVPENVFSAASDNGQMLGLITFSLLFAIVMTRLPRQSMEPLRASIEGLNDVMLKLTQWIMIAAPIGIFGLIFPVVYRAGGEVFGQLAKYFVTVALALLIHFLVTLPLILRFVGKVNPWRHLSAMRVALLTAFSTASSSASLPTTMRCVQENAGVSKRVASFTLPLGATVNMNGTALYECIAVIFVAQVMGMQLGILEQALVVIAALMTSVGVAGIPSASLVAILLILKNTNVPNAELAIAALFAVDRPLDMARTALNVYGDSCAAVVIARTEGEEHLLEGENVL